LSQAFGDAPEVGMRIGVLGTGTAGRTFGAKLLGLGHEVQLGARSAANENAISWAAGGEGAGHGTFAAVAGFGQVLFNSSAASIGALTAAGESNLAGKLLIDISNSLDFSQGMPPILTIANDDSLGQRIQQTFPSALVVKALNTMNCEVMVDPERVPGDHVAFVCGNSADAKAETVRLLEAFGWPSDRVIDLGGKRAARATEMYLPLWVSLMEKLGTARFNITVAR
jgi:8-hydroxy-5-deazaflavin:NADPH oxidoreductase